jgi:putative addiction module killer protein
MNKKRRAIYYKDFITKKEPAKDWIEKLKDLKVQARIFVRIERAENGNFGDHKCVGDGVYELRLDIGPGYRLYFAFDGTEIILLLLGGDKSTQRKDIDRAKKYWQIHQEEIYGKRK